MKAKVYWSPIKGWETPIDTTDDYKYHCGNGATLEKIDIKDTITSKDQCNKLIEFLRGNANNLEK